MTKEMEECREAYEKYVDQCIKEESKSIWLQVGYSGWIDFKSGWFAAKDST